jgi:hypothetical protein
VQKSVTTVQKSVTTVPKSVTTVQKSVTTVQTSVTNCSDWWKNIVMIKSTNQFKMFSLNK